MNEFLFTVLCVYAFIGLIIGLRCAADKIQDDMGFKENILPTTYGGIIIALLFLPTLIVGYVVYLIVLFFGVFFRWKPVYDFLHKPIKK